jgi:hypothetical protein
MLTNHEQRRLLDMETQFQADDPALARRISGDLVRRPRPRRLAVALAASMTLAVIVLLTYGVAGALVVAFAGLLVANYLAHRYIHTRLGVHDPSRGAPQGHYPRHGDHMD